MSQVVLSPASDLETARQQVRATERSYAGRRLAAVLLPALAGLVLLGVLAARWPAGRPPQVGGAQAGLARAAGPRGARRWRPGSCGRCGG